MKKLIALLFAGLSALYLLTLGIAPDPLPFIDEAVALMVLVQSLAVLGIDVRRFLPFIGKRVPKTAADKKSPVVDV